MTNTNLKALAEAILWCAEVSECSEDGENDQISLAREAAVLLTALTEPLGEEPSPTVYDQCNIVDACYANYWRTACLKERVECAELKSANSLGQSLLSEAHAKINELAALKQEQSQ